MKPTVEKSSKVRKRPRWWTFPAAPCSLGFFRLPEKSVVHLVPPVSEDGPFSHTAICGLSAYIGRPVQRFDTVDGQRVNTGIGQIIWKDVQGWIPSMPPDGVERKLCERCRRAHNAANAPSAGDARAQP